MIMINHADIDIAIARYFAGEATPEEIDMLLHWVEESEENRLYFFRQKDVWHALHPAFDPAGIDVAAAERSVLARMDGTRRRQVRVPMWLRMAAACVLAAAVAVGATLALNKTSARHVPHYTVATSYGYTMETLLPDSSRVWLNANSSLQYPAEFRSSTREVTLSGEAYFEVKADREHPFRVHTADMTVTATGTQFNVNAYPASAASGVTLVDGRVTVACAKGDFEMLAGRHLSVEGDNHVFVSNADVDRYCSWRDGVLMFSNNSLAEICARLEQIYNVQFDIDSAVADVNFHIILKGENMSEILRMLELSAPVTCTVTYDADKFRQHIAVAPAR